MITPVHMAVVEKQSPKLSPLNPAYEASITFMTGRSLRACAMWHLPVEFPLGPVDDFPGTLRCITELSVVGLGHGLAVLSLCASSGVLGRWIVWAPDGGGPGRAAHVALKGIWSFPSRIPLEARVQRLPVPWHCAACCTLDDTDREVFSYTSVVASVMQEINPVSSPSHYDGKGLTETLVAGPGHSGPCGRFMVVYDVQQHLSYAIGPR